MVETRRQKALRLAENGTDGTFDAVSGDPAAPEQPQATMNTTNTVPARLKNRRAGKWKANIGRGKPSTASAPAPGPSTTLPALENDAVNRWNDSKRFHGLTYLTLLDTFDSLERTITQWRGLALPLQWPWDEIPRRDQKWLLGWAPNARQYLTSQGNARSTYFINAWIWRIIWEELFAPEAPNAKWRGRPWKGIAAIDSDLSRAAKDQPCDSQLSVHYRSTRFGLGRLAYMQHGDHINPDRLERKIVRSFEPWLRESASNGIMTTEELLAEVVRLAIWMDFYKHFSVHPVEITWSDPLTGKERGFKAREYDGPNRAMDGEFLHSDHDNLEIWGFDVDLICHPFVRVFGQHQGGTATTPPSAFLFNRVSSRPTLVFVDCPRRADIEGAVENGEDKAEGDGEGDGDAL